MNEVELIIYGINNGVEMPDGTRREFDILDFYNIYNGDIYEFIRNNEFNCDEARIINQFAVKMFGRRNGNTGVSRSSIVSEEYFHNVLFGIRILKRYNLDGVEYFREITDDEKIQAWECLNGFNAVITHKSFNSVIERFFNNIPLDSKMEVEELVR